MWGALEKIAIRESLPAPLTAGESIHGILIARQLDRGWHNLHYLGRRRFKPYLLKQFYSVSTDAFFRWQNEARFIAVPHTEGFIWPCEEWRGGLISPFPEGVLLDSWLEKDAHSLEERLAVTSLLAHEIARLHSSGIAHRGLSPTCIRIEEQEVFITDFGYARCDEWDDLWTDSALPAGDKACVSPEMLRGEDGGFHEDVYAFGTILHLLLSGKTAFGFIKQVLRRVIPSHVAPDGIPKMTDVPHQVQELASACLSPNPSQRPTIDNAVSILDGFYGRESAKTENVSIPTDDTTGVNKRKVMVFIKDDNRAVSLFDAVLRKASKEPSVFLFIGLIPNNLPSGHAERFKGSLFKKLGQGLIRCRAKNLVWSLRVFENTDPERTALELVNQYQPDLILLGKSDKKRGKMAIRRGFQEVFASNDIQISSY